MLCAVSLGVLPISLQFVVGGRCWHRGDPGRPGLMFTSLAGSLVDLTSLETVFIVIVILAVAIVLRMPNIVRPHCDTNKKLIADSQAFDLHFELKSCSELIMFLLRIKLVVGWLVTNGGGGQTKSNGCQVKKF